MMFVVTKARRRGCRPPQNAAAIQHPPLRRRVTAGSYRLILGLLALAVGLPQMVSAAAAYAQSHPPMTQSLTSSGFASPLNDGAPKPVNTFTDLPAGARETYTGSGIYMDPRPANAVDDMAFDIQLLEQNNYTRYGITPESTPGLRLGSLFIRAKNGQFVELTIHERAAYTAFNNIPTPQILTTLIYEGKIQVTASEFIELAPSVRAAFLGLPVAGEGDTATPTVAQMAELLQSQVDAGWQTANQKLAADAQLATFDIRAHFPKMTSEQATQYNLGAKDARTGHKIPDIISKGLAKMFGDQQIPNAGLPKGPAVWIDTKINGQMTSVLFQQFERMAVTVNPDNYDQTPSLVTADMKDKKNSTVVQIGLQGQIIYRGLTTGEVPLTPSVGPATVTPTAEATKTAEGLVSLDITYKYGEIKIIEQSPLHFVSKSNEDMAKLFNRMYEATGKSGTINETIISMPLGNDLASLQTTEGIKAFKGLKVFEIPTSRDSSVYMTEPDGKGTRYLQLGTLSPILGDYENLNRFKAGLNDPRYPPHSLSSELFLRSYLGLYGNVSFGEINGKIGSDLQPLIGYRNSQGEIDFSQVPLDISFNQ